MLSRRKILTGAAGAATLVATGGVWRVTRTPRSAFGPWALDPVPPADIRLDAFRHAILAPNPHNRQPWLIRLVGTDTALVGCDLERRLPETDPFDRQTTIGFGTFLEIARIAAAQRGYVMKVEPFPQGSDEAALDDRPVARLRFSLDPSIKEDPLFAQIALRRSNKEEYDLSRPVAPTDLARICSAGGAFSADPARVEALRAQIVAAIAAEMLTPTAHSESVELMRIGHREVDINPDGIELHGPMIEAGSLLGMIDREQLADPHSTAFRQGLDMMRRTYGSIPALVWITTPGNTRLDQLEAGRQYVRANLEATALGLGMHPMSQSLQEYQQVQPMFAKVHSLLGAGEGERVQMLARVGYGPDRGPTPRWPLETHIV